MMENRNVVIDRIAIHMTWKCTLRCKKCGAFIPKSYDLGLDYDYDYDKIRQSLKNFFEIVDIVKIITLTGGEAILHKKIVELLEFLLENENKFDRIDFQTNGTILFSEKLLSTMAKSPKLNFFIDNYSPEISTKARSNVELCEQYKVNYQERKYYGEDAHMNGWIDWSPRKQKITLEQAKKQFSICANGKIGRRVFVLYENMLTLCAMPFCRYRIGAQPKEDVLLLDLLDESTSSSEKQERLLEIRDIDVNPGCAYCNGIGVYENAERFVAGEQI